jgi:hypothetical protein
MTDNVAEIMLARTPVNGDGGNINQFLADGWSVIATHFIEGVGEILFVLGRPAAPPVPQIR